MGFAPGFTVPEFPVWAPCMCAHTDAFVSMTFCIDVHLFNLPLRVRTVHRKVKTPLSQAYDFFFPLFWPFQVWFLQAVSFV